MSSADHQFNRLLLQEVLKGYPVSFERAVEVMGQSPLIQLVSQETGELRNALRVGSPYAITHQVVTVVEMHAVTHPDTRETADLSRLIKEAETSPWAFEALDLMAASDLRRPGVPNDHLRKWAAERLSGRKGNFPRKKGTSPAIRFRDMCLTVLIRDVILLGFGAGTNRATRKSEEERNKSACDVVRAALAAAKIPCPNPAALEKIWEKNRHRVDWENW